MSATVLPLHGLDQRYRADLQLYLDHVPIALGLAAGRASVLLPVDVGPARARARIESLRREWHRLVESSISQALDDLGQVS